MRTIGQEKYHWQKEASVRSGGPQSVQLSTDAEGNSGPKSSMKNLPRSMVSTLHEQLCETSDKVSIGVTRSEVASDL